MPSIQTTKWDVVEHLKTEEDMALYLEAALEDGDPDLISAIIEDIASACRISHVAPVDLKTLLGIIKAAGLRLQVSVER